MKHIERNIQFIKAERKSLTEVSVTYSSDILGEFTVCWSSVDAATGKIMMNNFYLTDSVEAQSEEAVEIIKQAIAEGESDENENIDLYLAVRDTFDSKDCENFEINYDDFEITHIQFFDHTHDDFDDNGNIVTVKKYSANIIINDLFVMQPADLGGNFQIADSNLVYWSDERNQIWAKNNLDSWSVLQAIENKGFEDSFEWLKENADEII